MGWLVFTGWVISYANEWEDYSNYFWESESHSVVSDSLQPHGLYSPWNSLGQNTGVNSLSPLQGNLSNPGIEPRSSTLQADSLPAEPQGKSEDIKKRWQEYTEELYKKDLNDPDNHHGVIAHLEPDIPDAKSSGP